MKTIATIIIAVCAYSTGAMAQTYVKPHVTKNGTYVEGHYRSDANGTKVDNYGSQGNVNPFTGKAGTVDPYKPQDCGYTQAGKYVCR